MCAGSLSTPLFDWARNLLSSQVPQTAVDKLNSDSSAVCALFWNMFWTCTPTDMLADFADFFKCEGIV